MSKELKRVPLDFAWPLNKVWKGFLNPYQSDAYCMECPYCTGTGASPAINRLKDRWYGYIAFNPSETGSTPFGPFHPKVVAFARRHVEQSPEFYMKQQNITDKNVAIFVEAKRLSDMWDKRWCHHLEQEDVDILWEDGCLSRAFTEKPTAKQVNEWSLTGFGHDSCNQWIVAKAKCMRSGDPIQCLYCHGDGSLWEKDANGKSYQVYADEWVAEQPPLGPGFQLWENCSEGSPVSPVFETLDDLCAWCEGNAYTFAYNTTTKENWKAMLEKDFVHHAMLSADNKTKIIFL